MTRSRLALPFLTALLPGLSPSSSTHTTSFTTSTYSTPLVNATPLHTLTPFTPPTIPIDTRKSVESQVTYLWEHLYNPLFTSVTSMSTQLFQATFFTSPSIASTSTTTSVSERGGGGGGGGTEQYQELAQIDVNFNLLLLQHVLSNHTNSTITSSNNNNASSSESSALYKASVKYPTCLLDIFTKIRSLSYTSIYAFLYDLAALRHDFVTILNTYTTTNTHTNSNTNTSSTSVHTSSTQDISHTNNAYNNTADSSKININSNTGSSNSVYTDNILSAFDTVTAVGMNHLIVHKLELYQLHIAIYKEEEEAKGEGHMGVMRFNITTTTADKRHMNRTTTAANTDTNGNIVSNSNSNGNIDTSSSSGSGGLFSIDSDAPSAPILRDTTATTPATTAVTSDTTTKPLAAAAAAASPTAKTTTTLAPIADDDKDTNTKHTAAASCGSSSNGTKNTTVKAAKKKRKSPPIHDPPPSDLNPSPTPVPTTDNITNNTSNSVDDSSVNVKKCNKKTTATTTSTGSVDKTNDISTTTNYNTGSVSNGSHISSTMLVDEPTHTTTNNITTNDNNNTSSNNTSHNSSSSSSSSSNNSNSSNGILPCITDPKYIISRFMHMWRVSCEHRFFNHILAQTMNGYGDSSFTKLRNPVHATQDNGHGTSTNTSTENIGVNSVNSVVNGKLSNPVPLYLSSYTSNYLSKMNATHLFITNRSLIGWSAYVTQGVKDDILYEQKDLLTHMGHKEYLSQQQASELLAYNVPMENQISDQDIVNTMLTLSCSRSALPTGPTVNYWSSPVTYTTLPIHECVMDISGSSNGMLNETVTLLEDQYGAPTLPWNKAYHTSSTSSTTPTTASRTDKTVRHISSMHEESGGEVDGEREEGESEEGHNYDPTPDYLRQDETLLMLDRYCDTYIIL